MKINQNEKDVQSAVLVYLGTLENMGKVYYFRNNSFRGSFQRSNGSQGYIRNSKQGVPDIIVCYKGRYIGLEIKGTKGVQSDFQKQAEAAIKLAGGEYYIIRDLQEVVDIIN